MKVKKIQVFELSDGSLERDEAKAIKKQKNIDFKKGLFELFEKEMCHDMSTADIVDIIMQKKQKFESLF